MRITPTPICGNCGREGHHGPKSCGECGGNMVPTIPPRQQASHSSSCCLSREFVSPTLAPTGVANRAFSGDQHGGYEGQAARSIAGEEEKSRSMQEVQHRKRHTSPRCLSSGNCGREGHDYMRQVLSPAENVAATWYRSTPSHSSSCCLSREFLSPLAPTGVANRVQRRPTWRIRGPRYARSNPYYGSYRVSLRRSRLHHRVCLAENAQKTLPRARYFIRPWHRRSNRRNPGNPRHGRRLRPNPSRPSRRSHCAV